MQSPFPRNSNVLHFSFNLPVMSNRSCEAVPNAVDPATLIHSIHYRTRNAIAMAEMSAYFSTVGKTGSHSKAVEEGLLKVVVESKLTFPLIRAHTLSEPTVVGSVSKSLQHSWCPSRARDSRRAAPKFVATTRLGLRTSAIAGCIQAILRCACLLLGNASNGKNGTCSPARS